ncbi:porin [Paraburkholderia diazotrophica]|uniref:Outer membrane protein (Porin) n=1 Tax=Paraburkholderia diazotrophica TaxID=667676 RepID=A0A1H7B239_9BURK|nr:porin [Paraburkholderia diazotrophica]SEJ70297.1 Outer membrane protein (porin) [Paraburkholderia diazotrophica]
MKKSLLALAALGAFAGVAHAQSSVTLYGIIDEGFNINTNSGGKHLYNLSSGVLQGSRWGMRGTEDLGGGLKAIFVLESGFDVNNGKSGQGGLLFGRQAYVGLGSQFGTVTMGRQYDSVVDYVGPLEAGDQWGGYIAAHPGDLDNFNNAYRTNNAVKFTSANYAGLTFGGMYSLGGVAGDYSRNQIWSLGAGYNNGPLVLGVGYLNVRNPNVSFFGNSTSGTPNPAASNVASPVYSGYGSAHTYQVIGAGGAYTFGAATVGATYSYTRFYDLGSSFAAPGLTGQTALFNNAEINFKYQLTPALLVGAAYDYTHGSSLNGHDAAKYHQGSAGVDYFLSKRTDVYLIGVYQHASGTDSTGKTAVAAINGLTQSSNENQFTARIGIRHKF